MKQFPVRVQVKIKPNHSEGKLKIIQMFAIELANPRLSWYKETNILEYLN